jgi:Mg2+ and Co2+ transporter CorA
MPDRAAQSALLTELRAIKAELDRYAPIVEQLTERKIEIVQRLFDPAISGTHAPTAEMAEILGVIRQRIYAIRDGRKVQRRLMAEYRAKTGA